MKITQSGSWGLKGKYRIKKTNATTGEIISVSDWIPNLIMLADTTGLNIIIRRMANDLTYDCIITSAEIGTGTTPPTSADTDLETPVLTGIVVADQTVAVDNVDFSFFIADMDLANGTYTEFGLRAGAQLFARSLIVPDYVKGSNEDTTIEYTITASNT